MLQIIEQKHDPQAYENNVGTLETLLSPYKDERYRIDMKSADADKMLIIKKLQSQDAIHRLDPKAVGPIPAITDMKFEALMKLARRKGLLPMETMVHEIGKPLEEGTDDEDVQEREAAIIADRIEKIDGGEK